MEDEIKEIIKQNSSFNGVSEYNFDNFDLETMAKEIAIISPWRKFEGKVESFPVFIKTLDKGLWTIDTQDGLNHATKTCGEIYIDYYMPVPQLRKDK